MEISEFKKEFGKLLNETILQGGLTSEQYFERLAPIENLVAVNTPSELFRYRSCNELNIDSFDKDTIWAVNPSKFNDPHDSLFFSNRDYLYNSVCFGFSTEFRINLWKFFHEHKCLPDIYHKMYGEIFVKQIEQRLSEITIEEAENADITPPSFDQVSSVINEAQNFMRYNTKIACLSERINNSLMWAHYADYHKGFALKYNFSNNAPKCKCDSCDVTNRPNCPQRKYVKLYPVIYSNQQYDATEFVEWYMGFANAHSLNIEFTLQKPDSLYAEKTYLNKSEIWKYECEWRLICDCRNNVGVDSMVLENNKPTAIYYGTQISPINKKILQKLCESKDIEQYEMYIDFKADNYELKMRLIS